MEGIVLRRINYEETSFILTILSSQEYKTVIVKGAKKKNSSKLGISEPLTLIDFETTKSNKMPSLLEGSIVNNYSVIKSDLEKLSVASVLIEYAVVLKETDINPLKLYSLLTGTLNEIEYGNNPELHLFRFELVLLGYLGVAPRKDYIVENYNASMALIDSLLNLMNGEETYEPMVLRHFFNNYYEREVGIILKSKKLYSDLFER